jgi:hypothetical protein
VHDEGGTWGEIPGSPFGVRVVPSALDPEHTIIQGLELKAAVQTLERTVLVVGYDRFGNRVMEGGSSLVVRCDPKFDDVQSDFSVLQRPRPVQTSVCDNGDGTYSVKFRPLLARPHVLSFEVGCKMLSGSPLTIDVQGIFAEGPGLQEVTAGEEAVFSIIAPDSQLLRIFCESQSPVRPRVVTMEHGSAVEREWPVSSTGESDGRYPFSVRCVHTQAGRCTIMVLVDGQHITGSPFRPLIRPAKAVYENSSIHGRGLSSGRCDQTATFYITPRDTFQNTTGGHIAVAITPLLDDSTSVALGSIVECVLSKEPEADGSFLCSYVPKEESILHIVAKIDGWEVLGSPFVVPVSGLSASPPDCYATGLALTKAKAGQAMCDVYVHVRDAASRPVPASEIQASICGGPYMLEPLVLHNVTCEGKGRYSLSYTAPQPGAYSFSICVDRQPIGGSPFALVISPGPSASQCVAEGPGLQRSICGELSAFVISVLDEDGNPIGLPKRGRELAVKASLFGLGSSSAPVSVIGAVSETSDSSVFTATYKVELAGRIQLSVLLNNKHITASPFSLVAQASSCVQFVTDIRARRFVSDEEATFELRSLDLFGNATLADGEVEVCYKGASEASAARVSRKGTEIGVYRVSFTPRGWGTYEFRVLLGNAEVRVQAFACCTRLSSVLASNSVRLRSGL